MRGEIVIVGDVRPEASLFISTSASPLMGEMTNWGSEESGVGGSEGSYIRRDRKESTGRVSILIDRSVRFAFL